MSTSWVDEIGCALIHSTWIGAVVAMGVALAMQAMRGSTPQARYLVACVGLVLMVVLPATTIGQPSGPSAGLVEVRVTPDSTESQRASPPRPIEEPAFGLALADRLRPGLPAVVLTWLAGVGLLGLRLLGGWFQVERWRSRETRPNSEAWVGRLAAIKIKVGVRRAVALLESARVEVPTVIGWARPAILLPISALSGLDPLELDAILAHELAHIRRHDYLINLVQCVVEALLFYHPGARWVSRTIRQEREHCCDDLAVSVVGDRLVYAQALATMEGLRGPAFSLSPAANGGTLLPRIRRILESKEESMRPLRMLGCLAVVLMIAPTLLAAKFSFEELPRPKSTSTSRFYADIVTNVDEAPAGRLVIGQVIADKPIGTPFVSDDPKKPANHPRTTGLALDSPSCLDPPSEAEVWEKLPKFQGKSPVFYETQRENVRILIEKVGDKVDPPKVYPLAGVCELVHCHYKCSVYFDEKFFADYPIPFNHKKSRVEVVFIDKDHLRRPSKPAEAPKPTGESLDRQVERLRLEVEELKLHRELDRIEHEREINRLRLEKENPGQNQNQNPNPKPKPKPNTSINPIDDKIRYFSFFLGSFW